MLKLETIKRLWPHARPELLEAIVAQAPTLFPKFGMDSPNVVAHAMAQFSHECGADTEGVENLNYSASGLVKTWPSRFNSATAQLYAHQPRKIGNKVYGGRMGNRADNDDGYNNRGRGGSQVTGHDGYAKLARKTMLDLIATPDLVNEPEHWLLCAICDFILCGCLPFALRDDVVGVTHHLNGGLIGLAQRKAWLARWKTALAADGHDIPEPAAKSTDGTLKYGDSGWEVEALQGRLAALSYSVGKQDGDFSTATRAAVLAFQADSGLPTTGVVDGATRAKLCTAHPKPVSEERATATEDDLRDSGSETVGHGDMLGTIGKGAAGTGAAIGAAEKTGVIDQIKDAGEQFSELKSLFDGAQDALHWASAHWWIAAIVIGGATWYFGRRIIKTKLARYRAGHAMER